MTPFEFEALYGAKVTPEEYAEIEQIYLNAGEMDKEQFCKAYKQAKGSTLELVKVLSENVDGKRSHINRLDIKIQNYEHDAEMALECVKELRNQRKALTEANEQLTQAHNVCELQRNELALSLIRAGLEEQAINIVGRDLVVLLKFSHDIELSVDDKALIINKLQK